MHSKHNNDMHSMHGHDMHSMHGHHAGYCQGENKSSREGCCQDPHKDMHCHGFECIRGHQTRTHIGEQVPDFEAPCVMENGSINEKFRLSEHLKGHYGVIFFYPMDFTFVCPSEIIAFSNRAKEFEQRNARIVGISGDNQFVHLKWRETPVNQGGIGPVAFPLVADTTRSIAHCYGTLIPQQGISLRGTFIVDKEGTLHHMSLNNLPLGRNVDEALRLIDAWQHFEKNGEVCPAGWQRGQEGMKASPDGVSSFLGKNAEKL